MAKQVDLEWYKVAEPEELPEGRVMTVTAGVTPVCLTRFKGRYGAIDNRCPHQGGPLGEGQIENGYVTCPWHGYEYDPQTGYPPPGFKDAVPAYAVAEREDGVYVGVPKEEHIRTISDEMIETMVEWGVDTVFGMVGHSNLGVADAMRRQEELGKLRYFGIRHEGAAAFAASGYAKLTGRPAACFAIAGPGATNLLTGMWDAKVDRVPMLAMAGQVDTQVLGPGAFQEIDVQSAYQAVTVWQQVVLGAKNAGNLMALALKHAIIEGGVAALIFPNEVQEQPALKGERRFPRAGRVSRSEITPAQADIEDALRRIRAAKLPAIIVGKGAREHMDAIIAFAERLQVPVLTTFKAKGQISDHHPLSCGVLGRSGTPIAATMMGRSDCLIVLGASFSNHTGIASYKQRIQVDNDRMALGKFEPVDLPIWGDIGITVALWEEALKDDDFSKRDFVPIEIAKHWVNWRAEKASRAADTPKPGTVTSAALFHHLSEIAPEDAVLAVDVGNNTYSFGRYFECKQHQAILMSGYLGAIGFAFPAAMGAWAATGHERKIIAVAGDGGFGQYLAEFTTAVKYGMSITLVLLHNDELGKISKEQRAGHLPVWQTSLVNPNFAEYAKLCGGHGIRVENAEDLPAALSEGIASPLPCIVEVMTDPNKI
jgi:thiamine pyrophosphate-dependent acetolactate synthase large subunit-like protein/nitrite reductase/ring-hydroxylating ferredoxin subunit